MSESIDRAARPTAAEFDGLTHSCDDPACHVPGFVTTLSRLGGLAEEVERRVLAVQRPADADFASYEAAREMFLFILRAAHTSHRMRCDPLHTLDRISEAPSPSEPTP